MKLATRFGEVQLEHCLMIAPGVIKLLSDVELAVKAPTAGVMVGSITFESRQGNSGDTFWADPQGGFTLNTLGMPNPGHVYYMEHLPLMVRIAHSAGKPLFVSVAGFTPKEYVVLTLMALEAGADFVELNLGCPNVWGVGGRKPVASYSAELVCEILGRVTDEIGVDSPIGVKLSPIGYDPVLVGDVAHQIAMYEIKSVTCINTGPNGFALTPDHLPAISAKGDNDTPIIYGGLAGRALKPWAMSLIRQLRDKLPNSVEFAAAGGVYSAADVKDYQAVGAKICYVSSAYWQEGYNAFTRILLELQEAA